jgi:hypothetical protein
MMVAPFELGSAARVGAAQSLFEFAEGELLGGAANPGYDVAPDGQTFYFVQRPIPPPPPVVTHVDLVQNWFEELKAKVPTK